jgi:hypothetical protein
LRATVRRFGASSMLLNNCQHCLPGWAACPRWLFLNGHSTNKLTAPCGELDHPNWADT